MRRMYLFYSLCNDARISSVESRASEWQWRECDESLFIFREHDWLRKEGLLNSLSLSLSLGVVCGDSSDE